VYTPKTRRTPQSREPIHRPHSPKNPPSSAFSTVDLDETDSDSPVIPKRLQKRTVPKIVESAFGRNEQFNPVRSSQIRADSSPGFDLLVERRAARKAGTSRNPEARTAVGDMSWEELQELRRNTPEPGPPSPSTSKRGSVGPRGSSPYTPRQRPLPQLPNTIDDTERKMIEARKELAEVALRFRVRPPRSPLDSTSLGIQMNGNDETFDETTHPFDETTHPFDETTHPFDETTHPFDEPQTQIQDAHPFDEDTRIPSPETHPFDEDTQQPPDIIVGGQGQRRGLGVEASGIRMGISPVPSTPGSSKRRTEAFLTTSLLESRNGRHSRSPSHPPPMSPINHLRPGLLGSPNRSPRSPKSPATHEPAAAISPLRRLKVPTPITTLRNPLRSPRSPMEDRSSLSPQKSRAGAISPEDSRPRSMITQGLRELLENSPRTRRVSVNVELHSQTHGEA
jgi:hypothetical protein